MRDCLLSQLACMCVGARAQLGSCVQCRLRVCLPLATADASQQVADQLPAMPLLSPPTPLPAPHAAHTHRLIRGTIYPHLRDHPLVASHPPLRGLAHNVFFLDHDHPEGGAGAAAGGGGSGGAAAAAAAGEDRSKYNEWEAAYCVQLARYLLMQGYDPGESGGRLDCWACRWWGGKLLMSVGEAQNDIAWCGGGIVGNGAGFAGTCMHYTPQLARHTRYASALLLDTPTPHTPTLHHTLHCT